MKQFLFCALVIAVLTACNGNGGDGNRSPSDTITVSTSGDTSRAVPDSVTGGAGYMSSGNTASGNSNAGSLNNDTLPLGAGRNATPDSIKAKVLKQKGDTASSSIKHH